MPHPHHGHRERVRKRLQTEGLDNFQPHEVLELLLSYAIPRRNVNPLAHALVKRFGSLQGVLKADLEELEEFPMMGFKTASFLKEIGRQLESYPNLASKPPTFVANVEAAAHLAEASFLENQSAQAMVFCLGSGGELLASLDFPVSMDWGERMRRLAETCVARHIYHLFWASFVNEMVFAKIHFDEVRALNSFLSAIDVQLIDYLLIDQQYHLSMRAQGHLVAQYQEKNSLFFGWLTI